MSGERASVNCLPGIGGSAFYRWIWNYRRDSRPRLDEALSRHPHLVVVELRNRTELREFLAGVDRPTRY